MPCLRRAALRLQYLGSTQHLTCSCPCLKYSMLHLYHDIFLSYIGGIDGISVLRDFFTLLTSPRVETRGFSNDVVTRSVGASLPLGLDALHNVYDKI